MRRSAPTKRAASRARSLACALLLAAAPGCGGAPAGSEIEAVEYQWADQPADGAWKPTRSFAEIAPVSPRRPIWFRLSAPAPAVPDPALGISAGLYVDGAWVGDQRVDPVGTKLIVPLPPGTSTVLVRARPRAETYAPRFRVASQRALWAGALRRELPELVAVGTLLLAGLLLLAGSLRRRAANAYRGLGLFLAPLGVLTVLQLSLVRSLFISRPSLVLYPHELAGFLFPIGLADFTLAVFGDGRRRLVGRALRLYLAYAAAAVAAGAAGLVEIDTARIPSNLFTLFFSVHALALALSRARRGDGAARAFLWGFGALLAISVPELIEGLGITIFEFQTVPYGVLAFGVAMVIVIERRMAETRDALAASTSELTGKIAALEEKTGEVESLNVELKRQIAERSRQLAEAFRSGASPPASGGSLEEGDVVDDRYRVIRALGRGGMGAVYEVERTNDKKRFALKAMAGPATMKDAARFAREAEIAARLHDPRLVSVVDVGGARGLFYLVMELVEGRSLHEERPRFGDAAFARAVLAQVAEGVRALHRAGVIHRDLKPGNVLVAASPEGALCVKISDFGISRFGASDDDDTLIDPTPPQHEPPDTITGGASIGARWAQRADDSPAATPPDDASEAPSDAPAATRLTETGAFMGTPAYMAPELARGARSASAASDMFAFGVMAYELLAARRPFAADLILAVMRSKPLPDPAPLPEGIDPALASLVMRCLSRDPADRPTADEAVTALSS